METITLQLPDETLQRYRRGALAARKALEAFVAERLAENVPPVTDDLPSPLREEMRAKEKMGNKALLKIAQSRLPSPLQRKYSRLLQKNSAGDLSPREQVTLRQLGEHARLVTVKKAHAYLLLKWRRYPVPSLPGLEKP